MEVEKADNVTAKIIECESKLEQVSATPPVIHAISAGGGRQGCSI